MKRLAPPLVPWRSLTLTPLSGNGHTDRSITLSLLPLLQPRRGDVPSIRQYARVPPRKDSSYISREYDGIRIPTASAAATTMTLREKETFERLMKRVAQRPSPSRKAQTSREEKARMQKWLARRKLSERDWESKREHAPMPSLEPKTDEEIQETVESFPEVFRGAVEKAEELAQYRAKHIAPIQPPASQLKQDPVVIQRKQKLREAREKAFNHVLAHMENAESDLELWQVLEDDVFQYVQLLQMGDAAPEQDTAAKVQEESNITTTESRVEPGTSTADLSTEGHQDDFIKSRIATDDQQELTVQQDSTPEGQQHLPTHSDTATSIIGSLPVGPKAEYPQSLWSGQEIKMKQKKERSLKTLYTNIDQDLLAGTGQTPALAIFGQLYPFLLLSAAEILNQKFPASPLLHSILHEIKRHGPESYALGVTTALYNEVLRRVALETADAFQVSRVLREMDAVSVEPNAQTVGIVHEARSRWVHPRQWRGLAQPVGNAVATMSRYLQGREELNEWTRRLRERLERNALREAHMHGAS